MMRCIECRGGIIFEGRDKENGCNRISLWTKKELL